MAQDDMGAKKVEVLRYRKRVIYSLHIAGSTSNPCFFFFLFSFELKPNFDGRRHENKFFKLGGQLQKCEVQKGIYKYSIFLGTGRSLIYPKGKITHPSYVGS